jgi:predicted cupin superfamily sugar epimerase
MEVDRDEGERAARADFRIPANTGRRPIGPGAILHNETAESIIAALSLAPHPEGGFYRETFRDARLINGRAASTAIYYLLVRGRPSRWHRVDASEVWHWYGGASVDLSVKIDEKIERRRLGPGILQGEQPQWVVPAARWQSAETLGDWTLVGCTVAPGFEFSGFELASS